MSLSEVLVFHQALQHPQVLTQDQIARELDLSSIPETNADQQTSGVIGGGEITTVQKRAHKMFYKVWSGLTKHLRSVLFQQGRPIELPGFAIFAPIGTPGVNLEKTERSPNEIESLVGNSLAGKRWKALGKQGAGQMQLKLILHSDFLNKCGDQVNIPQSIARTTSDFQGANNVVILSKEEGDTETTAQSLFHTVSEAFGLRSLQQVNYSSVAKACQTDSQTVELIIREIVATMAQLVSKGSSININFKVGLFSVRNGYMNFK